MSEADVSELAPRRAITLLVLCYAAALVPMFFYISPPAIGLVGVCLWVAWRGGLESIPLSLQKILVFCAGLTMILVNYGTLIGLEPGISFLLVLLGLKLLESRRPRDFQVLVLLGYFVALTLVFFSPGVGMVLAGMLLVVGTTAALIQSLVGNEPMPRSAWGEALKLLVQGLPLVAILFILFPRGDGLPFEMRGQNAQSGFGDTLEPGSISSIALSDAPAFRAVFPDGDMPGRDELYWRGLVLMDGAGLNWHYIERYEIAPPRVVATEVRQQITLLPHQNRWLFALDRPSAPTDVAALMSGDYLITRSPVTRRMRYDVVSQLNPVPRELSRHDRLNSLRLRGGNFSSQRLDNLVKQLVEGAEHHATIVERTLRFFGDGGFRYSLQPGAYRSNNLDAFLFQRKIGFCEHYAGAFATILRMAGVPTRIVLGYQGGSLNPRGNYILVRQADAHAWCEVWLEGIGWQRVDPTAVLAPSRITFGLEEALADSVEAGVIDRAATLLGMSDVLLEMTLFWDNVEFQWDQYVLNFGTMTQWDLFNFAGFSAPSHVGLLLWLVAGAVIFVLIAGSCIAFANRSHPDPVVGVYQDFCKKAATIGCVRAPTQGPRDFGDSVINILPQDRPAIEAFIAAYLAERYGQGASSADLKRLRYLERTWRPSSSART